MKPKVSLLALSFVFSSLSWAGEPPNPITATYYVYVAAESDDTVDLVKFGPDGGVLEKRIPVGIFPNDIEGPHGVRVAPNGRHWFVSIAHGMPYGYIYKYETGSDLQVGESQAGLFPATMDISPTTGFLFVVNFNLHGDHEPGSLSVVDTVSMSEIAQIEQGIMPHGSRLSPDAKYSYSVAMMSGELYEIDTMTFEVKRTLALTKDDTEEAAGHRPHKGAGASVKPTWVQPHPEKRFAYVALNGASQVVEVDLDAWAITRRFHTHEGPYNLAITPNGKILIATEKSNHSTAFWDIDSGKELASVPSTRPITHGVTVSPDSRLAFISVEGRGGQPGTVEVFDLETFERRAAIDVGKQASGIDFWKMVP